MGMLGSGNGWIFKVLTVLIIVPIVLVASVAMKEVKDIKNSVEVVGEIKVTDKEEVRSSRMQYTTALPVPMFTSVTEYKIIFEYKEDEFEEVVNKRVYEQVDIGEVLEIKVLEQRGEDGSIVKIRIP